MIDPVALARELREAERTGTPVELLTDRFPGIDFAAARSVARARDALRIEDGDRRIGYKLGWTSAAMRQALGIDRPNWGTLWASQRGDGRLDCDRLIHPKVEPELVARVGVDGAPQAWALGLEVVDPRFPSYDLDWLDNTADNSSAAHVVVGDFVPVKDPATVEVTFGDGSETRTGLGSAAMGDPVDAVRWLSEALAADTVGLKLEPGQIVFTGGLCAPFDLVPGTTYTLASDALGSEISLRGRTR